MKSQYSEAIDWLFEQFPAYHLLGQAAYNPGLKNIIELAEYFGNPHKDLRFIHVGGTNGKGSTSNMIASVLTECRETVGLFTSPHIFDFTERIRVNGSPIEEEFVVDFCKKVRAKEWTITPSFFEITWMMALCYFKKKNCTIVVAEVGLGGRLDATNIIQPLLSIITNIGLDHTHILGNTRKEIAFEKAGIIKHNTPVIFGEKDEETYSVFHEVCKQMNADILPIVSDLEIPDALIGYQRKNYEVAYTALNYLKSYFPLDELKIQNGIKHLRKNTGFFGRLEVIAKDPLTIIDCAHNAHGITALLQSIPANSGQLHIVYGTSSDKDFNEIKGVLPVDSHYYYTTFNNPRSATIEQLKEYFEEIGKNSAFFSSPLEAYKKAQETANKEDSILIFGSFFLAHDFFKDFFKDPLAQTK